MNTTKSPLDASSVEILPAVNAAESEPVKCYASSQYKGLSVDQTDEINAAYSALNDARNNFRTISDPWLKTQEKYESYLKVKAAPSKSSSQEDVSIWLVVDDIRKNDRLLKDKNDIVYVEFKDSAGQPKPVSLGPEFSRQLNEQYVMTKKVSSLPKATIATIELLLAGRAITDNDARELIVCGRYGRHETEDVVYEFLSNKAGTVVETSVNGVRELPATRVDMTSIRPSKFIGGVPHRDIDLDTVVDLCHEMLEELRVPPKYRQQVMAFLIGSKDFSGEYALLKITGRSGTGKSFLAEAIESLIDPKVNKQNGYSANEDDLAAALSTSYVVAQHNVSSTYSQVCQDRFCSAADGQSLCKRQLYADFTIAVGDCAGPVIFTSLERSIINRSDLLNRTFHVELTDAVPVGSKLDRRELSSKIERQCSKYVPVLRALHSMVLAKLPEIAASRHAHISRPRRIGQAISQIMGFPISFDDAVDTATKDLFDERIGQAPFIKAVVEYVQRNGGRVEMSWSRLRDQVTGAHDSEVLKEYERQLDPTGKYPLWPVRGAIQCRRQLKGDCGLTKAAGLDMAKGTGRDNGGAKQLFTLNNDAPQLLSNP